MMKVSETGNVKSLAAEIARLENVGKISQNTGLCILLVGLDKASPLSPTMHNAAYGGMGEDILYIRAATDDLKGRVGEMRSLGARFRGASVGIPYKQDIMQYLDSVDETSRAIGAVNTVVNRNGKLYGYNSDWTGAEKAIGEKARWDDIKSATLVGAGGAGMAIAYMLKRRGIRVTVYNRTPDRAEKVAAALGVANGGGLAGLEKAKPSDLIVNATSVGSKLGGHVGESLVPEEVLRKSKAAFDAVYLPRDTKFLEQAKAAGLTVVHGDRMLLFQAVTQVELFTGRKAPVDTMEKALNDYLRSIS